MELSQLASLSVSRFATPLYIATTIFGVFTFLDTNASKASKKELSEYMLSGRYQAGIGELPKAMYSIFTHVMGERQLSIRCLRKTVAVTLVSTAMVVGFSIIYNYKVIFGMIASLPEWKAKTLQAASQVKDGQIAYNVISALSTRRAFYALVAVMWIPWCFIPDYVSVLKTRVMLILLQHSPSGVGTLLVMVVVDFMLSVVFFMASFVLFQMLIIVGIYAFYNGASTDPAIYSLLFGAMFTVEFSVIALSGSIFFSIPFANIFWVSFLPSLWLWVYVATAAVARLVLRAERVLSVAIRLLDFDEHPVRALGVFAAGFGFALSCVGLTIIEVAGMYVGTPP